MNDGTITDSDDSVESITAQELKERIDSGEDVFLLDARAESEFEEWHIDGENVDIMNYPYFELLDRIPDELLAELPEGQEITALCAKGGLERDGC